MPASRRPRGVEIFDGATPRPMPLRPEALNAMRVGQ